MSIWCFLFGHGRLTLSSKYGVDVDMCPRCGRDFLTEGSAAR